MTETVHPHSRKNWDFLTSFSLSNKSTNLAYKISYRKISEISVKDKFCDIHFHQKFSSEKPLTTSVLWMNFDQKVASAGKWGMGVGKLRIFCGFDVHSASFSLWNWAFLSNVWAFHFCMWILTTTAFHSPKIFFHGSNADIFPLCMQHSRFKEWTIRKCYICNPLLSSKLKRIRNYATGSPFFISLTIHPWKKASFHPKKKTQKKSSIHCSSYFLLFQRHTFHYITFTVVCLLIFFFHFNNNLYHRNLYELYNKHIK
jgi:hypothetical protein